ncbi:MAG TPA: cytochrome P450, partial [Solirubrobacteraceae bacterium]|nr:cytochrome P450 [Solirubrobacteraceae bacterium]
PERLGRLRPFTRLLYAVDKLLYAEIDARRRAEDLDARSDILSLLVQAREQPPGCGPARPMSDRQLRDELMTLLVAGHETTATALAWALERLTHEPAKLARLAEEVRAGREEYLEAVVTETLRLRPVISVVVRRLTAPVSIGGLDLAPGVAVVPSIYLMHRRPDVYPDPERFEPERFLGQGPGTYTWIPFGGGVRRCIGAAFAQSEMRIVLAELLRRRELRAARPRSERVVRRAVTETPRYDAEVVLR